MPSCVMLSDAKHPTWRVRPFRRASCGRVRFFVPSAGWRIGTQNDSINALGPHLGTRGSLASRMNPQPQAPP